MPTYEYHCPRCSSTYELRQGFDAEITQTCEQCGKGIAKRVLHAPRVVFKGSGFYATDSRKTGSPVKDAPETSEGETKSDDGEKTPVKEKSVAKAGTPGPAPAAETGTEAAS